MFDGLFLENQNKMVSFHGLSDYNLDDLSDYTSDSDIVSGSELEIKQPEAFILSEYEYDIDVEYKGNTVRIEVKTTDAIYSQVISDTLRYHYTIRSSKKLCYAINKAIRDNNVTIEKKPDKLIATLTLPIGVYCMVSTIDLPVDKLLKINKFAK